MIDEDDEFWTTYISVTPDEDKDFAGCCGPMLVVLGFVVLVIVLALVAAL